MLALRATALALRATMTPMKWSHTGLGYFRRDRGPGVAFFIFLVLLVGVERRLAEAHFNLRTASPGIESTNLDGDELRVRLIVFNDDKAPAVTDRHATPTFHGVHAFKESLVSLALGRPAPRGPPAVSCA
jgi:hypothetical protein